MRYEKHKHADWFETADQTALRHLKGGVLRAVDASSGSSDTSTSQGTGQSTNQSAVIVVNFHRGLVALLRETRYLDRMGYVLYFTKSQDCLPIQD